jgi:hypothetical protein
LRAAAPGNNRSRDLVRGIQAGADRVKGGGEAGLQSGQGGDDADGDQGGDQAILDGGGAGLILHKARNELRHALSPMASVAGPELGKTLAEPSRPEHNAP